MPGLGPTLVILCSLGVGLAQRSFSSEPCMEATDVRAIVTARPVPPLRYLLTIAILASGKLPGYQLTSKEVRFRLRGEAAIFSVKSGIRNLENFLNHLGISDTNSLS